MGVAFGEEVVLASPRASVSAVALLAGGSVGVAIPAQAAIERREASGEGMTGPSATKDAKRIT